MWPSYLRCSSYKHIREQLFKQSLSLIMWRTGKLKPEFWKYFLISHLKNHMGNLNFKNKSQHIPQSRPKPNLINSECCPQLEQSSVSISANVPYRDAALPHRAFTISWACLRHKRDPFRQAAQLSVWERSKSADQSVTKIKSQIRKHNIYFVLPQACFKTCALENIPNMEIISKHHTYWTTEVRCFLSFWMETSEFGEEKQSHLLQT